MSEYDPGRVFALEVVEGTPVHLRIALDPADDGRHMRFRGFGELFGAMRLMQPLLRRVLKRQFTQQLATLKHVLASGQTHTVL